MIYERTNPGIDHLEPLIRRIGGISLARRASLQEFLDQSARFSPVMQFTLLDEQDRSFFAQRWRSLGSMDGWVNVGPIGSTEHLARKLIPRLGTDAFFDIY